MKIDVYNIRFKKSRQIPFNIRLLNQIIELLQIRLNNVENYDFFSYSRKKAFLHCESADWTLIEFLHQHMLTIKQQISGCIANCKILYFKKIAYSKGTIL